MAHKYILVGQKPGFAKKLGFFNEYLRHVGWVERSGTQHLIGMEM